LQTDTVKHQRFNDQPPGSKWSEGERKEKSSADSGREPHSSTERRTAGQNSVSCSRKGCFDHRKRNSELLTLQLHTRADTSAPILHLPSPEYSVCWEEAGNTRLNPQPILLPGWISAHSAPPERKWAKAGAMREKLEKIRQRGSSPQPVHFESNLISKGKKTGCFPDRREG